MPVVDFFDANLLRYCSIATVSEHRGAGHLRWRAEIQAFSVHQGSSKGEQVKRGHGRRAR